MPANLSIKNVPEEVITGLRNRAVSNQRSLNAELLEILKQAARGQTAISIDTLLERAQKAKPALDETASRVLAARDSEHEKTVRRFEDLLGGPDHTGPGDEEDDRG
jgi:plasmid stability protein